MNKFPEFCGNFCCIMKIVTGIDICEINRISEVEKYGRKVFGEDIHERRNSFIVFPAPSLTAQRLRCASPQKKLSQKRLVGNE